jgi:hypothetical protein
MVRVSVPDLIERLLTQMFGRAEAEGGADSWARPLLPKLNEKKDSISASAAE